MLFRVSGRARTGRQRRRRMAVARLGDAGDAAGGGRLWFALGRIVLPRLRLRALLLRSRRALARLRNFYADVMKGLVADAAAGRAVEARAGTGETLVHAGRPAPAVVVPAAVAGAVLRCNSHYYVR